MTIKIHFNDHAPPHFHAEYQGEQVIVDIQTLGVIAGRIPPRAMGMVMEWASIHQRELLEDWRRAQALEPLIRIDPLV